MGATLFYLEYDNHMSNWKGNTEGGKQDSYDPNTFLGGYVYENTNAKVKSQGFEIASNWNPKSDLNIKDHYILELGGALGAHAGPNSLVAGFQEIED